MLNKKTMHLNDHEAIDTRDDEGEGIQVDSGARIIKSDDDQLWVDLVFLLICSHNKI